MPVIGRQRCPRCDRGPGRSITRHVDARGGGGRLAAVSSVEPCRRRPPSSVPVGVDERRDIDVISSALEAGDVAALPSPVDAVALCVAEVCCNIRPSGMRPFAVVGNFVARAIR